MDRIILQNCTLLDGTSPELRESMHVLIEGDRIREVSDTPVTSSDAVRFDLKGKTLMPGLIDAHVHLTATTLTQIIVEGRELSRLLPVSLLEKLIRLKDDALAEFFGSWVTGALDVYLQARDPLSSPWNPFSAFSAFTNPFSPKPARDDEVAELRRELDELRKEIRDRDGD